MKPIAALLFTFLLFEGPAAYCQKQKLDEKQFFIDETPVESSLETYWTKLISKKRKLTQPFPARFTAKLSDTLTVSEPVTLIVRGHFRRDYCNIPPLKVFFKKTETSYLYPLKSLKIVNACNTADAYEQYLFKEYLIYKIYNLLTDKSIRVRLIKLNYKDSNDSKKSYIQHAFFTEDFDDMAKRNKCKEFEGKLNNQSTDQKQMLLVALFEYMIGNTDWSVPGVHNIKLIQHTADVNARPFAVPFDFDFSGLVNTGYGAHDPLISAPEESVEVRVYRGFPHTSEEINESLEIFKQKKDAIYALINKFELLSDKSKKGMIKYLDEFYALINNPADVKNTFIYGARKD
jgi:hypothetical protein